MKIQEKAKWKTLRLPGLASSGNSLCKGIEVLDSYTLATGKRKCAPQDFEDNFPAASGAKKKKNNVFEVREEKKLSRQKKTKKKPQKPSKTISASAKPIDNNEKENVVNDGTKQKKKKPSKKERMNKPAINLDAFNRVLNKSSGDITDNKTSEVTQANKNIKKSKQQKVNTVKDKTQTTKNAKDVIENVPKLAGDSNDKKGDDTTDMSEWIKLSVCDEIVQALKVKGFTKPTPIQERTLPAALKGIKDIVGAAETGSGKTLAFAIPIIQGILKSRKREADGEESGSDDNDTSDTEDETSDAETDEAKKKEGNGAQEADQENVANDEESDDDVDIEVDNSEEEDVDKDEEEDIPIEDITKKKKKKTPKASANNVNSGEGLPLASSSDCFFDKYGNPVSIPSLDSNSVDENNLWTDLNNQDAEEGESIAGKSKQNNKLRALILTPTRELAVQIKDHIQDILRMTNVTICVVVGGMSADKQLRLLKRCPDIVVGTPGRLWELYQEGVPHLQNFPNIKYLAIDETDRMGEKGHFAELENILEAVNSGKNKKQRFVMSATLSMVHKAPYYKKNQKKMNTLTSEQKLKELMAFAGVGTKKKVVDITKGAKTAESLSESVLHCNTNDKDFYLYYFLKTHRGRTIVFCNSIESVRRLNAVFELLQVKPLPLHAQMHQKARLKNLERFSANIDGLLIATDVAARGLDIPNIDHIVHFQVPRTCETYIHRSGRTARAHKSGLSVLLIDPSERHLYNKIRLTLKRTEDLPMFPVEEVKLEGLSERVECARRLDKLIHKTRKIKVVDGWMAKAADEADILLSDDDDEETKTEKNMGTRKLKDTLAATRFELEALLRKQVLSVIPTKYPTQMGASGHLFPQAKAAAADRGGMAANNDSSGGNSAIQALNSDLATQKRMKKNLATHQRKKMADNKMFRTKKKKKQRT